MPIADISALLKELPAEHFDLPHVSELRTHAFKVPLPGPVIDKLNPAVETHHLHVRIACIGDSITACGYPKYLQELFDRAEIKVQVRNFGVCGATAQRFADQPYWDERRLEEARQWRPHFVVSTLGSNDAKEGNWDRKSFVKDYADLGVEFLERLAPRPEVFFVTPPPVYQDGAFDISQEIANGELSKAVEEAAVAAARRLNDPIEAQAKRARQSVPAELLVRTGVIDAFTMLGGDKLRRRNYIDEDGVHLNERGTKLLATTVFADVRRVVSRCLRRMADAASVVPEDPLGL